MSRILRLPDVIEKTGLGRSSIYKQMGLGTFPRPFKLTKRAIGWREEDIEQWLREVRDRPAEICKAAGRFLSINGCKGYK